jgi:hypothetical protein
MHPCRPVQIKRLYVTVTQLITIAFMLAHSRYPELHKTWISISVRVGGLLPNTLLSLSVQRAGELDMVLRCMEDDFSPEREGAGEVDLFSFHYQKMLSDIWVGKAYEIFSLLINSKRKLAPKRDAITDLARDLKLLRIPLEKHEIANDRVLSEPLQMERRPPKNNETDIYLYSKSDPQKAMPLEISRSSRGSVRWHVIDVKLERSCWLERRALSERIIALWGPVAAESPVFGDTAT